MIWAMSSSEKAASMLEGIPSKDRRRLRAVAHCKRGEGRRQLQSLTRASITALIVVMAVALSTACALSAPVPAFADTATMTQKQVLEIAKKYDKNAYHILKTQAKRGDDIMYWMGTSDSFAQAFDTAVHEECHAYMMRTWGSTSFYIGNKKTVKVKTGKVYRTKKMAKSVPKKLRTERYYTYVAEPTANLASNVQGIYGLLNEFTAYCWGATAELKLYQYYLDTQQQSVATWSEYLSGAYSSVLAYAEFRYFIQHYLVYAKKHHPAVYSDIMSNKKFKRALKKVDRKFAATSKALDKKLVAIAKSLQSAGYTVYLDGGQLWVWAGMSGFGQGLFLDEYNAFAKKLGTSRYKKIQKKLGLTTVSQKNPVIAAA